MGAAVNGTRICYEVQGSGPPLVLIHGIGGSALDWGEALPRLAAHVSVSLHCEMADILAAYTRLVQADASLSGLAAYSAARPPHAEESTRPRSVWASSPTATPRPSQR